MLSKKVGKMPQIKTFIMFGFLESGKTTFIEYTLEQDYFRIKGKTLLIQCEEGEVEVEEALLRESNTVVEIIEEENQFSPETLLLLQKKHKAKRVIIEFNGTWNAKNLNLPEKWEMVQVITFIDASTFESYFKNMRSFIGEAVKRSELVFFNRCDTETKIGEFKRKIKAINQQIEIIFEDDQGEIEEILEEDLPYDINVDVIRLVHHDFGIFYLDALENIDRYLGKKVEFIGCAFKPKTFPKGYFVPGRTVMSCCEDDMGFLGFVCQWEKAEDLKANQWVKVIAEVKKEYWPDYQEEGPILYATSIELTEEPDEPIINFI